MRKGIILFTVVACLFLMKNSWAQGLPDTGQTKCYNNTGEISCPQPGEAFYGQDAEYVKARSYTDLGTGIVRDNVTGLEWVQDGNLMVTRNPSFDNDGTAGDGRVTWQHALDYVALLNADEFLGHDDWRLPTIQELSSLVDSSRTNPAIDPIFSAVESSYWSSTTYEDNTSFAWRVNFGNGYVDYSLYCKPSYDYVRAVRSGQSGSFDNLVINGDGTITDTATGLMWQQAMAPDKSTWQGALAYCEDLNLAGHTDWRLPDKTELQSIVDYSRINPTIDPVFSAVDSYYWSSTTYAGNTYDAWIVYFDYGSVGYYGKTSSFYVRAVRSGQYVLLGDLCDTDNDCAELRRLPPLAPVPSTHSTTDSNEKPVQ